MVVGTLRDQMLYPHGDNPRITDAQLQKVLEQVNLPDLAERVGGFREQVEWTRTLSLGEQQRIAFARILLAKPRYVVLDEATSALDSDNEESLYQLISDQGMTIISISHRAGTLPFHQNVLELGENGACGVCIRPRSTISPARKAAGLRTSMLFCNSARGLVLRGTTVPAASVVGVK